MRGGQPARRGRQLHNTARQLSDSCPTVARQIHHASEKCGSETGFRSKFLKFTQFFQNAADYQNNVCASKKPAPRLRFFFSDVCALKTAVRQIFHRIFRSASKLSRFRLLSTLLRFAQNSPKSSWSLKNMPNVSEFMQTCDFDHCA